MEFSVDIEPTNRCNAKCHFCPRDQTPHEGLMRPETFAQSLRRAEEFRDIGREVFQAETAISLCGLGEALLNKHTVDYTRQAVDAGFQVTLSTNASLLNEEKGQGLLDAGLHNMFINVGDEGDDYEDVYKLPFERTRDNILQFNEMSQDRCRIHIVLVDYRSDPEHQKHMEEYWRERGIFRFLTYSVMNRGGALFVDHMQFEAYPELAQARALLHERGGGQPLCGAPFGYLFIGYDGQYYLCCSDWKKETPMGSVFDESFQSVTSRKLQYVMSRDTVCHTCNLDPLNQLTEHLRSVHAGEADEASVDAVLAASRTANAKIQGIITGMGVEIPESVPARPSNPARRSIPVRIE